MLVLGDPHGSKAAVTGVLRATCGITRLWAFGPVMARSDGAVMLEAGEELPGTGGGHTGAARCNGCAPRSPWLCRLAPVARLHGPEHHRRSRHGRSLPGCWAAACLEFFEIVHLAERQM